MYIFGDIGNSETKLFLVNKKKKILKRINLPTNYINDRNLHKKIKFLIKNINDIEKILFCSVVPKSFALIKKYFSKRTKVRCYEIKNLNLKSLIKIRVNFRQVGSDRLANAISLQNNRENFIILDFGTATTFDVVIKKDYRGGIIAPGIKISLDTLSQKASLIPQINLKKINNIIANNTKSAVQSGFFWGYLGLIDNIINLIKKETRNSFKLVITGGYSDLFRKSLKIKVIHNRDITIKGLIKIAKLIK
tara:strand:- start:4924 stop:5670 length:747 start_codon:yes stop_codon:yes gene_type:complete